MTGIRRTVVSAWVFLAVWCAGGGVALAQDAPETPPPASVQGAASRCDGRGGDTLVVCIPRDLARMVRGDSLVWLLAGGGLAAASAPLDDDVDRALRDGSPNLHPKVGDRLGQVDLHIGLPFAVFLVARAGGHSEVAGFAVTLLRAQLANAVVTRSLKLLPRARPYQEKASGGNGSFPSGHASTSFATATVFQRRWGWKAGVPAYLVAGYVGLSRLHEKHYLSDVAFGAGLGIAAGLAVDQPSRRASITPIVGLGRAGVAVDIDLSASGLGRSQKR